MSKISIIVPSYNEEEVLPLFYDALCKVEMPGKRELELIFVDDGSQDGTLKEIKKLAEKDVRVKYISFSRNFGKEAAMFAGLEKASGDYVAIMDADLQDPPEMLPEMIRTLDEGEYDCVGTRRVTRKGEPPIRSMFARLFYKIMRKMTGMNVVDGARDYRVMTRKMVDAIVSLREVNRFSKGIFTWVGFKTKWLEYENRARAKGETKWSFWKLFRYSIDGIVGFSTLPLAISSFAGFILCLISFAAIIFVFVRELIYHNSAYGWASMICIILLLSGIQLFSIGVLGQYLAKTYVEVKKRPIYITREDNISDTDAKD